MKLETRMAPPFTSKFQPRSSLSLAQWESYISDLEDEGCQVNGDQFAYTITFPEREYTYAPTLGAVHKWLFDNWGLLYLSWRHGLLCPFDKQVGTKNITCSNGRRKRCNGLAIHRRLVAHLCEREQRKLIGRVVCYEWCHILSIAYWDIPTAELLELPDDINLVAFHIMRRIIRDTGWLDWKRELGRRQNGKRLRDWITPLPSKNHRA